MFVSGWLGLKIKKFKREILTGGWIVMFTVPDDDDVLLLRVPGRVGGLDPEAVDGGLCSREPSLDVRCAGIDTCTKSD
jgi:hypothetical protein